MKYLALLALCITAAQANPPDPGNNRYKSGSSAEEHRLKRIPSDWSEQQQQEALALIQFRTEFLVPRCRNDSQTDQDALMTCYQEFETCTKGKVITYRRENFRSIYDEAAKCVDKLRKDDAKKAWWENKLREINLAPPAALRVLKMVPSLTEALTRVCGPREVSETCLTAEQKRISKLCLEALQNDLVTPCANIFQNCVSEQEQKLRVTGNNHKAQFGPMGDVEQVFRCVDVHITSTSRSTAGKHAPSYEGRDPDSEPIKLTSSPARLASESRENGRHPHGIAKRKIYFPKQEKLQQQAKDVCNELKCNDQFCLGVAHQCQGMPDQDKSKADDIGDTKELLECVRRRLAAAMPIMTGD